MPQHVHSEAQSSCGHCKGRRESSACCGDCSLLVPEHADGVNQLAVQQLKNDSAAERPCCSLTYTKYVICSKTLPCTHVQQCTSTWADTLCHTATDSLHVDNRCRHQLTWPQCRCRQHACSLPWHSSSAETDSQAQILSYRVGRLASPPCGQDC